MSSLSSDLSLFTLSQSTQLHTGAVRTIDTFGDLMVTGSLDSSIYLYSKTAGPYEVIQSFEYHDNYVYCAKFTSDGTRIVSGGKDCKALVVNLEGELMSTISGHENAVNYVQELGGTLMTGSWDATAALWDLETSTCVKTLKTDKHSHAVTGLLTSSMVVTGSQSGYMNFWSLDGSLIRSIKAHDEIIRDIISTDAGILTCSNDLTVRLWSPDGRQLSMLKDHSGFVFALAVSALGEIASGSDDRTAKIWRTSSCVDTIPHANTVWDLSFNSEGDLITAGADCFVRIFTRDGSRVAPEEELKAYGSLIQETLSSQQVGLDMKDVPDIEQLAYKQGKRDGEVAVFNNNGTAEAYIWHADTLMWERAGEVCGVNGAMTKKHYAGDYFFPAGEYEYIFDVEIGDGLARKLPFNNTDNTLLVAEKFCTREGINREHVQMIMRFLEQNAKPVGLISAPTSAPAQAFFSKPYSEYFPVQQMMFFESLNVDPILKKIKELGQDPVLVRPT